ncbi:MAG TPA: AAA family ATPase, partial [Candidatus Obscuribacterales bacterium]
ILEDGRLTDSQGRTVDFKNTLLIMTSNIGSRVIEKGGGGLGFDLATETQAEAQYNRVRSLLNEELKQYFRPELLNRLDEIIVFRQLTREEVKQISDLMVRELSNRLSEEQGITLQITERMKDRLVAEGYNPSYGARSLRRTITRLLEDALAEAILSGRIYSGAIAVVDVGEDGQVQVHSEVQAALIPAIA